MNMMHGLKITAVGTVLALAGCLGADQKSEAEIAREKRVAFVNETSQSAVEAAGIPLAKTANNDEIAKALDQLGCPKLSKLFSDLQDFQGTWEKPLPASFLDYLSCFGINGNGTLDDIDVVYEKLQNPTALLDCICGGSALSDLWKGNLLAWTAFDGSVKAASGSFDGSTEGATGSFNGSTQGTTGTFNGSSNGATSGFGD